MSKTFILLLLIIIVSAVVYEVGVTNTKKGLETAAQKTGDVLNTATQATVQKTQEIKNKLEQTPEISKR